MVTRGTRSHRGATIDDRRESYTLTSLAGVQETVCGTGLPFGQPYTLDQAYPFTQNAVVALGLPEVMFQPDAAFAQLSARQNVADADVVLGPFHAHRPQK